MKKCTSYIIEWNENEEDYIKLPPNCLSYTFVNNGNSKVAIDETVELEPNEAYPVAHHVGYYHVGQIKMRVVSISAPYNNHTKVIVRTIVED